MERLSIEFPSSSHFSMSQTVRIQDVNYRKHLGHDKLVSMLHDARAAFLESLGVCELRESPHGYILADLQIMYIDEAFFGEELTFELAVTEVSRRSCKICYQVSKSGSDRKEQTIISRAQTGVVFYDYEQGQAMAIPESVASLLST